MNNIRDFSFNNVTSKISSASKNVRMKFLDLLKSILEKIKFLYKYIPKNLTEISSASKNVRMKSLDLLKSILEKIKFLHKYIFKNLTDLMDSLLNANIKIDDLKFNSYEEDYKIDLEKEED